MDSDFGNAVTKSISKFSIKKNMALNEQPTLQQIAEKYFHNIRKSCSCYFINIEINYEVVNKNETRH